MTASMLRSAALFFVTGAPRTGTTFVSDWISESPEAYCVHEVAPLVQGMDDRETLAYLRDCARTGRDRLGKPLQREFMRWDRPLTKEEPRLLGFKEPVTWPVTRAGAPHLVGGFLRDHVARCVVLVRHPYDAVASGMARARQTRNWPGFSVEAHARFWHDSLALHDELERSGVAVRLLRFEELLLERDATRERLETLLGIPLPEFEGHERTSEYLARLRAEAHPAEGTPGHPARRLLSEADLATIRRVTAQGCRHLGYAT